MQSALRGRQTPPEWKSQLMSVIFVYY